MTPGWQENAGSRRVPRSPFATQSFRLQRVLGSRNAGVFSRSRHANGGWVVPGAVHVRRKRSGQDLVDGRVLLQSLIPRLNRMVRQYEVVQSSLLRQRVLLRQISNYTALRMDDRLEARLRANDVSEYLNEGARLLQELNTTADQIAMQLQAMQHWRPVEIVHVSGQSSFRDIPRQVDALQSQFDSYVQRHGDTGDQVVNDAYCRLNLKGSGRPPKGGGAGASLGVQAEVRDVPDGIANFQAAYQASWESQMRLFQEGTPVGGDRHRRKRVLADQSYVVIQAHQPKLTYSGVSQAALALTALCGAAVCVGLAVVGGVGLLATVGAALAGTLAGGVAAGASRAKDAAWQLYTVQYYDRAMATIPRYTAHCYGWLRSPSIYEPVTLEGNRNPDRFYNFADNPGQFSWWTGGDASVERRTPAIRQTIDARHETPLQSSWLSQLQSQFPARACEGAARAGVGASSRLNPAAGDALVQSMAAFETSTTPHDPWSRVRAGDLASPWLGIAR